MRSRRRQLLPRRSPRSRESPENVLRLIAEATSLVLTEQQVTRAQYPLMEFLPTARCEVRRGPGVEIVVRDRGPADLMPAILRRVEEAVGCAMWVEGTDD